MKGGLHVFLYSVVFIACQTKPSQNENVAISATQANKNTSEDIKTPDVWTTEFERLRKHLIDRNVDSIATYFSYPISKQESDDLLHAAQFLSDKTIKEFTILSEKGIRNHFDELFPKILFDELRHISTDSLMHANFAETDVTPSNNNSSKHKVIVSLDKASSEMSIQFYTEIKFENVEDVTESSVIYVFSMNANKLLQFKKVDIAG